MPLIPQTLARISTSISSVFIHRSDAKYKASAATKYIKFTFQTLLACGVNTYLVLFKYPGFSYHPFKFTTLLHTPKLELSSSLIAQLVKKLHERQETQVGFLGWEDPLQKEMATHSGILAWRIPWTEEPGRLESMGSQRV